MLDLTLEEIISNSIKNYSFKLPDLLLAAKEYSMNALF